MNKSTKSFDYRVNNLNIIRLFAAFQVLMGHLFQIFHVEPIKYWSMFNGVPIFFTISGFLIFWSYDNNPNIKSYMTNRCLRIYPALIAALILTITLMLTCGTIKFNIFSESSFYVWICAQLTIFQEFAPNIVRGFGGGNAPNPSLWTISVEMLLYMFIPLLYRLVREHNRYVKTFFLLAIGTISYCQNQTGFITECLQSISSNGYWHIFINPFCQFFSFIWYFIIGILYYLYKDTIIPFLAGKGGYFLLIYIALSILGFKMNYTIGVYNPHSYAFFLYLLLTICIFSLAYTKPMFTKNTIGKTDISYGLYIYHLLILRTFVEFNLTSFNYMILGILLCFIVAYLSWNFIEKKALKLKSKSLYKGA